nr:hypothetical protein [Amycolatopsis bullii]
MYLVIGNFPPHRFPDVRKWAPGNQVELLFQPTCGSWLNTVTAAIAAYIRWRDIPVQPKTGRGGHGVDDPGVVDQHVNPAVLLDGDGHEPVDDLLLTQVADRRGSGATRGGDLLGHRLRAGGVDVGDHDAGASAANCSAAAGLMLARRRS